MVRMGTMRRLVCAAFLGVWGALAPGCFGGGDLLIPTGAECAAETIEDAALCEGGVCLVLFTNEQGMAGMCSKECYTDDDCTPHEGCESTLDNAGNFCLRACNTDDDCYDAFVCRLLNVGNPRSYCLIDPIQ